eukprot:7650990-Alexandrium_andersonii.AAC.1
MIGAVRSKRNKMHTDTAPDTEPDDEMQCPAPEFPPLPPKHWLTSCSARLAYGSKSMACLVPEPS